MPDLSEALLAEAEDLLVVLAVERGLLVDHLLVDHHLVDCGATVEESLVLLVHAFDLRRHCLHDAPVEGWMRLVERKGEGGRSRRERTKEGDKPRRGKVDAVGMGPFMWSKFRLPSVVGERTKSDRFTPLDAKRAHLLSSFTRQKCDRLVVVDGSRATSQLAADTQAHTLTNTTALPAVSIELPGSDSWQVSRLIGSCPRSCRPKAWRQRTHNV